MAKAKDKWAQIGYIQVVESAANTLTFNGLSVFSNILTPQGLIIHDIEYNVSVADWTLLVAALDEIAFGMGGDDGMTAVALDDAQIYDYNSLHLQVFGTPANAVFSQSPIVRTFDHLPGGGLLVPADRIYMFVRGASLASAVTMECRFHFTLVDLSAQEYIELAQALRVLK